MNWNNVDLNSPYESSQNILDPFDFDTLLLEISCNLPKINAATVREQAMISIRAKYESAVQILDKNLNNIVAHAQKDRAKP